MRIPEVIVLDYETAPIAQRPAYPPEPVGASLIWPGQQAFYMAWGHPTMNNCRLEDAKAELHRAWDSGLPILCHHAKFDLAVSYERLGLPRLPWERIHDTMFLAYLCDPHARSLGLKPLAADFLNWPPEERDELNEWIMAHAAQLLATYPHMRQSDGQRKITPKQCGAWIWATPGDICGRYANGDVDRTLGIFRHLLPIVDENGMTPAYERERRLLPILMENEEIGLRVDMPALERDIEGYGNTFDYVEDWLRRELHASGLNFDADQDVASVLMQRGIVPPENWMRTKGTKAHPEGQLSVSKENLRPEHFTGPNGAHIASALGYRNRLKTCLDMFMRPWHSQASQCGGYIKPTWNQVRSPGESGGTRSGRPSMEKPNLLNISKDFNGRDDGYEHPEFLECVQLPLCRTYVLPDEGGIFLHRDFDGQELRIFAHFEQGDLWNLYQQDPKTDPHKFVGAELMRVAGREIERTKVKTMNFQGLYGGGVPALQRKLRCSLAEAKELKQFHDHALPGRKLVNEEIKRIVRRGDPIRTWGGRLYFPEPPGPDGRSKEYKLLNYVVQGSAADLTKEAIICWYGVKERTARFLITVYDEINISADPARAVQQMAILRESMNLPRLSVPMLSTPKHGLAWGLAKHCPPEKGCPLCV